MGGLLARFRNEKTTFEVLEKLEQKIKEIEEYGQNTERRRKQMVANFLTVSVALYFIAVLLFYIYSPSKPWLETFVYATPFIAFPAVIFLLKKVVAWHYTRKLKRNANKLSDLRVEKNKILEEVMNRETYKIARSILERFGDRPNVPASALNITGNLRQRNITGGLQTPQRGFQTPVRTPVIKPAPTNVLADQGQKDVSILSKSVVPIDAGALTPMKSPSADQSRPLLRPIINSDRGVFEKMVDYIVGDGPNNRFALICKQCHNHNGMALREEFEYLAFRCVFCATFNAARKQRPSAPPLSSAKKLAILQKASTSSSDDEDIPQVLDSGSDTEEERVEQPNEPSNENNDDDEKKEK